MLMCKVRGSTHHKKRRTYYSVSISTSNKETVTNRNTYCCVSIKKVRLYHCGRQALAFAIGREEHITAHVKRQSKPEAALTTRKEEHTTA